MPPRPAGGAADTAGSDGRLTGELSGAARSVERGGGVATGAGWGALALGPPGPGVDGAPRSPVAVPYGAGWDARLSAGVPCAAYGAAGTPPGAVAPDGAC